MILRDLGGSQFEWVGSSYVLAATAFMPLNGGLAQVSLGSCLACGTYNDGCMLQVFGRRKVMLWQLFLFGLGSAMSGAAPSLNFLIAGRSECRMPFNRSCPFIATLGRR